MQFCQHLLFNWQNLIKSNKQITKQQQNSEQPISKAIQCNLFCQQPTWKILFPTTIETIDLKTKFPPIENYQLYQERGLQAIKNQQVCFVILAGGKNMRYDLNAEKQCEIFQLLPSKLTLIELILKKFGALSKLIQTQIHIYILVNDDKKKKKIRKILNQKIPNSQDLDVSFLIQTSYGCLNNEGQLVVTDDNQIFMHPNGNGDIWGNFQGENFGRTGLNKFRYVQVFGVSNVMEHCFDCFMIGKLVKQHQPWITMVTQNQQNDGVDPVIFINHQNCLQVRDPQQVGSSADGQGLSSFPKNCPHVFLNNSVFDISFVQRAIKSKRWFEFRKYHCKRKYIDFKPPLSKYSEIYVFEKQISDIFGMTDIVYQEHKSPTNSYLNIGNHICGSCQTIIPDDLPHQQPKNGIVVLMDHRQYHSPFYTKQDKISGTVALSQKWKNWLDIPRKQPNKNPTAEEKLREVCEIDSYVSLEGENLEEMRAELLRTEITYPLYIAPENNSKEEEIYETGSPWKNIKFSNMDFFLKKQ